MEVFYIDIFVLISKMFIKTDLIWELIVLISNFKKFIKKYLIYDA